MIVVSLNVGGGVRLIKPAKLYMCTQTQRGRTHGAGCVRQWFRTAEPLGERRYKNWNTHTHMLIAGVDTLKSSDRMTLWLFFVSKDDQYDICSSCACLMRPPSQGTKPYQEHFLRVVFCLYRYSFAGLISRTPPPTFSDTAITHCHSDTTFFSSEHTECGYPGLLDRKNRSDMCRRWESNPRFPA